MDTRPIGIFDTGLGGITAMKELLRILPNEEYIYFGDTARVPYGTRSRETIKKYTLQAISFLNSFNVKAILIACGTASSVLDRKMRSGYNMPVLGVVEPSAKRAAQVTKNGKIGLIATPATVGSGAYEKYLAENYNNLSLFSKACPLFVPLVENGRFSEDDIVVKEIVREYLAPLRDAFVDTLILGCTHYPLLEEAIAAEMGEGVRLINSGAEAAFQVKERIIQGGNNSGKALFYVSDSVENFSGAASMYLGREMEGEVLKVDIENVDL